MMNLDDKYKTPVHKSLVTILDRMCGNDPSAGSPTETLLRLLLSLDSKVWITSRNQITREGEMTAIQNSHRTIQSIVATGGVYKGQGRNQCKLMTCVY